MKTIPVSYTHLDVYKRQPHVQGIVAPAIVDDNAVALEIWRRYLAHVLSKRIMLRQEINIFRNLLENKSINSEPVFAAEEGVEPETEISETESLSLIHI